VVIRSRIRIADHFFTSLAMEFWEIYLRFSYSHHPIFTTLGEMTDADMIMNPQYFVSDPADIRIRIRINPKN